VPVSEAKSTTYENDPQFCYAAPLGDMRRDVRHKLLRLTMKPTVLPPLALSYSFPVAADTFDELRRLIASSGQVIEIEEREPDGPQAGIEWLLPTAVLFFIGKSYFDGIFKELGKDHYGLMKQGLKTLYARLVGPQAPATTVLKTAGKSSTSHNYSLLFSLLAEADDGLKFKLLIQQSATEIEYEATVSAFIEFLDAFHRNSLSKELIGELGSVRIVGRTVLVVYSAERGRIVPVDPMQKDEA
jgi:hypothetical protein